MELSFLLIYPPIAFFVIFIFLIILSHFTDKMSFKNSKNPSGKTKAYACGEDVKDHRIKPNYVEFFPVAFFFTIMHVITLMIATTPEKILKSSLGIIALFVITAYLSILIIFRRERND
ncbi:MAG: NADH-quinone oxidoreductase subunit A [Endomicrobia bacterium]|nr:NADH-quinone oxidoreductase subunit A [Endomicrobiia bacterium]MCL2507468.1 NADH-quinone oxidoreductase subunit A [Endomicrobiia bacterium]